MRDCCRHETEVFLAALACSDTYIWSEKDAGAVGGVNTFPSP